MKIEPLGDAAFIVRDLGSTPAFQIAEAVERLELPGLIEVSAAYDTIGLYVDPLDFRAEWLRESLAELDVCQQPHVGNTHLVPVCYEMGEDLESSAAELGLSIGDFVASHSSVDFTCFALGFAPGFPYLGHLPDAIRGLPRLACPRIKVSAGTVAIAEDQAGIYPGGRPGGWRLVGVTPLTIVDVAEDYFPISAGDTVRFNPISETEFKKLKGERL